MTDPNASNKMTTAASETEDLSNASLRLFECKEEVTTGLDLQGRAGASISCNKPLEVLQVDRVKFLDHRILQADRRHRAIR